jgi:hypothetical protein
VFAIFFCEPRENSNYQKMREARRPGKVCGVTFLDETKQEDL